MVGNTALANELRDRVAHQIYRPAFVATDAQLADVLTKGLRGDAHRAFLHAVLSPSAQPRPKACMARMRLRPLRHRLAPVVTIQRFVRGYLGRRDARFARLLLLPPFDPHVMPGNLQYIVNGLHAAGLLRLAFKLLALVSAGHIVMSPPAAAQHMFASTAVAHVFAGAVTTRSGAAMQRIVRQAIVHRSAATTIQAAVRGWLARCLRKRLLVLYSWDTVWFHP